ncbi:hypothetical protein [Paraburkholderia tuberum]|uniref:hypothetical protein n=1 Tax=Paraburkholderia TaxID=1822464 RepID=UPI000A2F4CBB|nr:hypothetical protein [Paraburkholderia sp. WSM4179]
MLYLKNTLGGLSRSLTDSALHSFQGPHRWWKLALFAGLFVLPGGSVGVALLAWTAHRRGTKRARKGRANSTPADPIHGIAALRVHRFAARFSAHSFASSRHLNQREPAAPRAAGNNA